MYKQRLLVTNDHVLSCKSLTKNVSFFTDPFVSAGWLVDARVAGIYANSSGMLLILRCTPTAFFVFLGGTGTGFVDEAPAVDD